MWSYKSNLAYKTLLRYKNSRHIRRPLAEGRCPILTKFVWRTDYLHSKSPLLSLHLAATAYKVGQIKHT